MYIKEFATFVKKITKKIRDVSGGSHDLSKGLHQHKDGQLCSKCARSRELSKEANKRFMNMVHLDAAERKVDKTRVKEEKLAIASKGSTLDPEDKAGKSKASSKNITKTSFDERRLKS